MIRRKVAAIVAAAMTTVAALSVTSQNTSAETLPNGYAVDMTDLPRVRFGDHPEWEELYTVSWQIHKNNIKQIPAATNPARPYYMDAAFSGNIYAWDTLFMMMYDKYGLHQFPTLASMDNFYMNQTDNPGGENDGYIPREIIGNTGQDYWEREGTGYKDPRSMNPPLWGWAEWEQYLIHGDAGRFGQIIKGKTIFERLESHFAFIERYKKTAGGLYGKTNGYGNGLDNTFNQGAPYEGYNPASDGGQTYNDLSIQQAQFAYYLAKIAGAVGNPVKKAYYEMEHTRITALINEKLWSEDAQMYANLAANGITKTNVSTPTALWALAAHVATPERAEAIITAHGRNSEKLFRPQGLATTAYDHPGYQPEGGYWRGAVWAPTSYQYIKGLSETGYGDMAFEEALRHLTAVSEVYQAGKTGGYVQESTLWENYSAEYTRNGYNNGSLMSRPEFMGWTGCLSIGVMIEDVLGIRPNAPENTITWDVRLTETHGIERLYMKHAGVANRVTLMAEERVSGKDAVQFSVTAEQAFTLTVRNGSREQTYAVQPGTHTYTLAGEAGSAAYLGAKARTLSESGLSAADIAAAADYVIFGLYEDNSITDGLKRQESKGTGLIRNVNTVGYPAKQKGNPVIWRDSPDMQKLGFAGAVEAVKPIHNYGAEGFMFTVPADNRLRTVWVIVGVEGGTGELTATLSDASCEPEVITVADGVSLPEGSYVMEIPYIAADDGRYLLVKWTNAGRSGSVSLKGIILTEGGIMYPRKPVNVTAAGSDKAIHISAQPGKGDNVDGWKIYWGFDPERLDNTVEAATMPTALPAENGRRYYIAVAGISNNMESKRSDPVAVIPEPSGMTGAERARTDLESAVEDVLNGNPADAVIYSLKMETVGAVYNSVITVTSDFKDINSFGVRPDGNVARPLPGMRDAESALTLTAVLNGASSEKTLRVKIPAADKAGSYAVSSTGTRYSGKVYLTEEGAKDWVQVMQNIDGSNPQSRKAGGKGIGTLRRIHEAVPSGEQGMMTDANLYYIADDAGSVKPVDRTGSHMRGQGNYLEFDLSYADSAQRVYIYCGVWHAQMRLDFLINGEICASETVSARALQQFRAGFLFRLHSPSDKATVRITLTDDKNYGVATGSAYLNAITLAEIDSSLYAIAPEHTAQIPATGFIGRNAGDSPYITDATPNGKEMSGFGAGTWLSYPIQVETTGIYTLLPQFAGADTGFRVLVDGRESVTGLIPAGARILTLVFDGGGVLRTCDIKLERSVLLGDVNNSGRVEVSDARMILQYLVGKIKLTDEQLDIANVSGGDRLGVADARLILQMLVNKITVFPREM
ncbi:MAG: hypothetical protein FWE80_00520 [Oscillospiraceae bacterium]|nr:hypothetical protein [Oscillospiraceae bacterium]